MTSLPYPSRMGAPMSNAVQSDGEFVAQWNDYLGRKRGLDIMPGSTDFGMNAPVAQPWIDRINNASRAGFTSTGDGYDAARGGVFDMAQQMGLTLDGNGLSINPYTQQGAAMAPGISQVITDAPANPAYLDAAKRFGEAQQSRSDARQRQQGAYDKFLMGGNATGGVLPDNYGDAGFGQVGARGNIGGLGGLGGFNPGGDNFSQGGASYQGGAGSYGESPWSPNNARRSPWGGY